MKGIHEYVGELMQRSLHGKAEGRNTEAGFAAGLCPWALGSNSHPVALKIKHELAMHPMKYKTYATALTQKTLTRMCP